MDLVLNEEEQFIKKTAREFLEAACTTKLIRAMEDDPLGYPADLWGKIADLGWLGMALPEKHGGQGLPLSYLGLILEELGYAAAPVPFHCTMITALAISQFGNDNQSSEILPQVVKGDMILTWAIIEKNPRLLPETIKSKAEADGDSYIINGTKLFVESFNSSQKCLVACRTSQPSSSNEGISLFLVDTKTAGITEIPLINMAKEKQSKLVFNRVSVPKSNLVGKIDEGWPIIEQILDTGTALLCTQMVGSARKQVDLAIEYAKVREAFGKPIAAFQAIAHPCADMIIWVDGGQMLTYEALWRIDQGLPASVEVSQAKAFCNDKCLAVGHHSNIIHGGIAFMQEFDLNLWFRRTNAMTMKLGTSFEHRSRVAKALIDQPGYVRLGASMYELADSP
jgi:alkylation response protein AidB-like acyl-CoA dehydrogenase